VKPLVDMNFLHFAVVLFAVSTAILVVVSLATQSDSLARLRGLTFATLDRYILPSARSRGLFQLHLAASIGLAVFVIGLWVHFA
jgi:SSS family solute:Na+ symporter